MRTVRNLEDVVDWGHCVGCGACRYFCDKDAVSLMDLEDRGIRPLFHQGGCGDCTDCLAFCPGIRMRGCKPDYLSKDRKKKRDWRLIGPYVSLWEGWAADPLVREEGSSGGVLSALSLFCLESGEASSVLHTGMSREKPWSNETVISSSRKDILNRTGSRYAPSSPCEGLGQIENSDGRSVFIGKPCDAVAVSELRKIRPSLDANLCAVLAFVCAGVPSTQGALSLLRQQGHDPAQVTGLRFRGPGWPGRFEVKTRDGMIDNSLSYTESWTWLANYRSFRCLLCPDGLGERSDITCGDAWHRPRDPETPGISLVIARTKRGHDLVQKAREAGYLDITEVGSREVFLAQGLIQRRRELLGRLLAMKLLLVPAPRLSGFFLFRNWMTISPISQIRIVLGTMKSLVLKRLIFRNPCRQ